MQAKRSTRVITLGIAVFIVGSALTFIGLRSGNAKPKPAAKPGVSAQAVTPATKPAPNAQPASPVTQLPDGTEAVAVQLPYVPGVAGYVRADDRINVYATIKNGQPNGSVKQPLAKLVLSNVRVLAIQAPPVGSTDGTTTFLLQLVTKDAEEVIFLARYESLWFSIVKPNAKPATSHGRGYDNLL